MPDAMWPDSAITMTCDAPMKKPWSCWAGAGLTWIVLLTGCEPIDVRIVGTYALDDEVGCDECPVNGPERMAFLEAFSPDEAPRYRFDFDEGQGHGGTYRFEAIDTTQASLVLYPDSAGAFHAALIGDAVFTEYNVKGDRVTERCGSGVRRCLWRKE